MEDRNQRDEKYRRRWPRAVPAFEVELAAAEALTAALTEQTLNPGPEADQAIERAQRALDAARSAYHVGCHRDEVEQIKMRAVVDPAAQQVARLRDDISEHLETIVTTAAAWSKPGTRKEYALRFRDVERLAGDAARLADPSARREDGDNSEV